MRGVRAIALAGIMISGVAVAEEDEHRASMLQMSFLTGDWIEARAGRTVQEHWLGPVGGIMAGFTVTHSDKPGAKTAIEFMSIEEMDGKLTFIARLDGAPPTAFPLKEADNGYAVFENPDHDFPQRITYELAGEMDVLNARIDGTVDGKPMSVNWSYKKMAR